MFVYGMASWLPLNHPKNVIINHYSTISDLLCTDLILRCTHAHNGHIHMNVSNYNCISCKGTFSVKRCTHAHTHTHTHTWHNQWWFEIVLLYLMQKHPQCKKVWPSRVEWWPEVMHNHIGNNKMWYQNMDDLQVLHIMAIYIQMYLIIIVSYAKALSV